MEWAEKVFSISQEALYGNMQIFPKLLMPLMKRATSPQGIPSLVESFNSFLLKATSALPLPPASESVPLQDFLFPLAYKQLEKPYSDLPSTLLL